MANEITELGVAEAPRELTEELKSALLAILENIETEDEPVRLEQLKECKRNNLLWHGFQYLYWSDGDMDWRVPTQEKIDELSVDDREETECLYNYVINIFKAHGESIIAALSADLPTVRFGPRDADNINDIRAVRAADSAVKLISRRNQMQLQIIHALFLLATEGFIASYTHAERDGDRFGHVKVKKYDKKLAPVGAARSTCMSCGYEGESVQGTNICPACGQETLEVVQPQQEEVPVVVGEEEIEKYGEIVEVFGPANVRVPRYISNLKQTHYLILYKDGHPATFMEEYPGYSGTIDRSTSSEFERSMRMTSIGQDDQVEHLTTEKKVWLRPSAFNILGDSYNEEKAALRKMFPRGVQFSVIGDEILSSKSESLDSCWTVAKAGPSKGIHADPMLKSLISPQELRNEMTNLLVMTAEHSVPVTYADTEVYDFEGASRQESSPGYVYPAKARPGKSISDGFYQTGGATLSRESSILLQTMDNDAQFVVGDFPSVHGGPAKGGSKTLGEYDKSRAFALQRLSLAWYYLSLWFGETMHKAVKLFVEQQLEDEVFSLPNGDNNFKTIRVRQEDFANGSFEFIEPEVSSAFPVTFAQKRGIVMELAMLNNEEINSVLFNPDNAGIIKSIVGLPDLKVPSDIQRGKQRLEILRLVQGVPSIGEDGMTPRSSVDINPDIDDHPVHMEVLRNFLVSDTGLDLEELNPDGYANCVAHYMEHKMQVMLTAMPPEPMEKPNIPPPGDEE